MSSLLADSLVMPSLVSHLRKDNPGPCKHAFDSGVSAASCLECPST